MRVIRWVGIGVVVAIVAGVVATWVAPNFDEAQATTDRQTIDCLTSHLTQEDLANIARFADKNDDDSLWRVYDRVFPDCAVRGDQRDRKAQLEAAAWRILSSDPNFMRMREANAALAARAAGH
ncbi:hypothetical protein LJ655_24465 [Paraburkholderia sp. MMS20-SJTN17]|uniref:Uncharacterized protein n=1 Tax=Paraburkholderia translucens TaxID=2886945 RepID=A0ABS8KJN9_9BURK|nr:hypothetical protein [Paraburkholderia sp. MMS20-SJTN17]MCC8404991.1 hypothetical protein [Paraburkholderia sp. MMS20-SJTN17]